MRLAFARALGDFPAEAGFFETDLGFFDFRRQAARFQPLLGFLNGGLRAIHIDVFGLFRDFCHDRNFGRRDFRVSPQDGHMIRAVTHAVAELADAQG